MVPQQTQIEQIVATIWQSVLGLPCEHTDKRAPLFDESLSACVQIMGPWQGAVVLTCPIQFAARAATIMFNIEADQVISTDMQDAVAELANMVGGNFKGLLTTEQPCQLSLPTVVAGIDFTARIPGSRTLHRIATNCDGQIVIVEVVQRMSAARAA